MVQYIGIGYSKNTTIVILLSKNTQKKFAYFAWPFRYSYKFFPHFQNKRPIVL